MGEVDWRVHAEQLLDMLQQRGLITTLSLERAFWETPRHLFIDGIYEYSQNTFSWLWRESPSNAAEDSAWLSKVYQDRPLVVGIDDSGQPYCSNSAPSLVFRILEFLNLKPGNRALEIGTGTGQLTVLISRLVGNEGEVASIEIESELAQSAAKRLELVAPGSPTNITVGDGRSWRRPSADCDAVVATGSCWPVPQGWLASLAPEGRLSVEVRGGLAGALLLARKVSDSSGPYRVKGSFIDHPAGFMPLRASASGFMDPISLPLGFGRDEVARVPSEGLGARQLTRAFSWYCQLEVPDATFIRCDPEEIGHPAPYLVADDGLDAVGLPEDGAMSDSELAAYGGTSFLLERVLSAWRGWCLRERPEMRQYSFESRTPEDQVVSLNGYDGSWNLSNS